MLADSIHYELYVCAWAPFEFDFLGHGMATTGRDAQIMITWQQHFVVELKVKHLSIYIKEEEEEVVLIFQVIWQSYSSNHVTTYVNFELQPSECLFAFLEGARFPHQTMLRWRSNRHTCPLQNKERCNRCRWTINCNITIVSSCFVLGFLEGLVWRRWSGRFLGITIGWDPSVCKCNRLHVDDILRFFFITFEVYSIDSSKVVRNFSWSLDELQSVISQTPPVHP